MIKKCIALLLFTQSLFCMEYLRQHLFPVDAQKVSSVLDKETLDKEDVQLIIEALEASKYGAFDLNVFLNKMSAQRDIFKLLLNTQEVPVSLIEQLCLWPKKQVIFYFDANVLDLFLRSKSAILMDYYLHLCLNHPGEAGTLDQATWVRLPHFKNIIAADDAKLLKFCIETCELSPTEKVEGDKKLLDLALELGATQHVAFLLETDNSYSVDRMLEIAAKNGHQKLFMWLVVNKSSFEDACGIASKYNMTEFFERYISQESDFRKQRSRYNQAIVKAAQDKDIEIFKWLYSKPPYPVTSNFILTAVIEGGSQELLDYLLTSKHPSLFLRGQDPIGLAINKQDTQMVLKLVENGFEWYNGDDYTKPSALFLLSLLTTMLNDHKALIEAVYDENKTLLETAIEMYFGKNITADQEQKIRSHSVIKLLLECGADTNRPGVPAFLHKA